MAKLSLYQDTRSNAHEGKQIIIRIYHNNASARIMTGVYCRMENFTGDLHAPITGRCTGRDEMEYQVLTFVRKAEDALFELRRCGRLDACTAAEIKDHAMGTSTSVSFAEHMHTYANRRASDNSKRIYLYALDTLCDFTEAHGMGRSVRFDQVTIDLVHRFDQWMIESGKKGATRYNILQAVRASYRDAVIHDSRIEDRKPFVGFQMPDRAVEDIDAMSLDELRKFLSLDLSNQQGRMSLERARDLALLSFYMCGINLKDIYLMERCEPGRIQYNRVKVSHRKSHRPVSFETDARLDELIDRYAGTTHQFNFCEQFKNYTTFYRNTFKRLERISGLLGFEVSFSRLRRTWATLADNHLDISSKVIDYALGHVPSTVLDKHYVKQLEDKLTRAHRRVIELAWEGTEPNTTKVPKLIQK